MNLLGSSMSQLTLSLAVLLPITTMVVLLVNGCSPADRIEESPLATWNPSDSETFPGSATGPGTLDVSAGCVRLILESERTILLVWPEPTSWNPSSQTIDFVGVRSERAELRDGDRVMLGGAGLMRDDFQFVSPPDPSCKADVTFIVNSLVPVTE